LYPLLEGSLVPDSNQKRLLISELDINTERYTGKTFAYKLEPNGTNLGEMTAVTDHQFLVIEGDGGQNTTALFKKIFLIDINALDSDGLVQKTEVVDLLGIADPLDLNGDGSITFTFPSRPSGTCSSLMQRACWSSTTTTIPADRVAASALTTTNSFSSDLPIPCRCLNRGRGVSYCAVGALVMRHLTRAVARSRRDSTVGELLLRIQTSSQAVLALGIARPRLHSRGRARVFQRAGFEPDPECRKLLNHRHGYGFQYAICATKTRARQARGPATRAIPARELLRTLRN